MTMRWLRLVPTEPGRCRRSVSAERPSRLILVARVRARDRAAPADSLFSFSRQRQDCLSIGDHGSRRFCSLPAILCLSPSVHALLMCCPSCSNPLRIHHTAHEQLPWPSNWPIRLSTEPFLADRRICLWVVLQRAQRTARKYWVKVSPHDRFGGHVRQYLSGEDFAFAANSFAWPGAAL